MSTQVIVRSTISHKANIEREQSSSIRSKWLFRGIIATIGILFTVLVLPTIGGFTSAEGKPTTASANMITDSLCEAMGGKLGKNTYPTMSHAWPGITGGLGKGNSSKPKDTEFSSLSDMNQTFDKQSNPSISVANAYQMFGTGGIEWKAWPYEDISDECGTFNKIGTDVSNFGLMVVKIVGEITLTFLGWAMSLDAFDPLVNALGDSIKVLGDSLRLDYLAPILIFSALWMAWKGLVKKRTSETIQGAIWVVAAGVAGSLFLINPTAVAQGVNNVTQEATTTIISKLSNIGKNSDGSGDMCYTQAGNSKDSLVNPEDWMTMQCNIWQTFIFTPWAAGQFGSEGARLNIENGRTLAGASGKTQTINNIGFNYLTTTTKDHDLVVSGGDWGPRLEDNKKVWDQIVAQICGGDRDNCDKHSDAVKSFKGDNWVEKLQVSVLALVGMTTALIPLMFLLMSLLVYQIILFFLFIASPFMLLLGIHPGFGRKAVLNWLGMIASLTMKRIGTAILIGGLLMFYNIIISAGQNMNFLLQMFFLSIAAIAIFVVRSKLLKAMGNVDFKSLGGTAAGGQGRDMIGNIERKFGKAAAAPVVGGARMAGIPVKENSIGGVSKGVLAAAGTWGMAKTAGKYLDDKKAEKAEKNMSVEDRLNRDARSTRREDSAMEELAKRLESKDPKVRADAAEFAREFVGELSRKGRAIPLPRSASRDDIKGIADELGAKTRDIEARGRRGPKRPDPSPTNGSDRDPVPEPKSDDA